MVFSFFSKKAPPPDGESPPAQLRTPSPSVDGQILHPNPSPSLGPPASPSPALDALGDASNNTPTLKLADIEELHALISSVPPKTFHDYTLSHLTQSPPIPEILQSLVTFFSKLAPPPQLHCVRCHKSYFDVENGDRSCLVPHDDDSAVVERVGGGYETLYGCCEKTVEGDGDMGPPDGYCYEGKHTTDLKRARFRADSSLHDDKLTSCATLRCFDPPASHSSDSESVSSKRPTRKRSRRTAVKDVDDDARSATSSKGKRKRPVADEGDVPDVPPIPKSRAIRLQSPDVGEEEKDTEEDATVVNEAETHSSAKSKGKGKAVAQSKPCQKRRKTTIDDRAFKPSDDIDNDAMDVDDVGSSVSKRKRKPRAPKKTVIASTPRTPSPVSPAKARLPFPPPSSTTSPILKAPRSSHSPTRSITHGRKVSFSSLARSVSVVVETPPRVHAAGKAVAQPSESISGEE